MADSKIVKPSETKSVSEIFKTTDLKIKIPEYQREYVWGEEQWENLIDSILLSPEEEPEIFLGFILVCLEKDGDKLMVYSIVDGQQRIITLAVIFAVLARIEEEMKTDGAYIRDEIFKQKNKGVSFKKIAPNSNVGKEFLNNLFYDEAYEIEKPKFKADKLLFECYEFFKEKLMKVCKTEEEIDTIYDRIKNDIVFSVTLTDDYLKAIKLFQVLNDNSVRLSSVDLFKNYLLSGLGKRPDSEIGEFADEWNEIQKYCNKNGSNISEYLLRYAMSMRGYTKKDSLFGRLESIYKKEMKKDSQIFLKYMQKDHDNYLQLFSPGKEIVTHEAYKEIETLLRVLKSLNASEPVTFFYTILSVFSDCMIEKRNSLLRDLFRDFLHFTIVRYKLKGSGRAYMHNTYPAWSMSLRSQSLKKDTAIKDIMKCDEMKKRNTLNAKYFEVEKGQELSVVCSEIMKLTYSSDSKNKKFRKQDELLKYLLCIFYYGKKVKDIDRAFKGYSIEHIACDSDKSFGNSRFDFGNLMLVEKDTFGDNPFSKKIIEYKKIKHLQSSGDPVLSKKTWSQDDVEERALYMAKKIEGYLK